MRVPPGSSFFRPGDSAGLRGRLLVFIAAYAGEYVLTLGGWSLLGQAALSGRFDAGWMTAWVAMMASALLFRRVEGIEQRGGRRRTGWAVKAAPHGRRPFVSIPIRFAIRALEGCWRGSSRPTRWNHWLWGEDGGHGGSIELTFAAVLLWLGAGARCTACLLAGWMAALGVLICGVNLRSRAAWMEARLEMTDDLVERMSGQFARAWRRKTRNAGTGRGSSPGSIPGSLRRFGPQSGAPSTPWYPPSPLAAHTGLAALAPAFLRSSSHLLPRRPVWVYRSPRAAGAALATGAGCGIWKSRREHS